MLTAIRGLRGQRRLRLEVVRQLSSLLERRRVTPVSVRVAFFDDDGPRGGVAIRCALTVTPKRGPTIRVEHTERTHSAAFNGSLAILKRKLKRHVQRRRRLARYPTRRTPSVTRGRRARHRPGRGLDEGDESPALEGSSHMLDTDRVHSGRRGTGKRREMRPDPVALLADLTRPEAYPAPRPTTVSLITTHISWVFVTAHEVWKLKRPVDYGFVDYTTRDRRRQFCHEEVRVNRRLAPDVYLGVVPVRLHRGRHSFTSNGTVVDYAVRMRRVPDTTSAESLLRHGALTHEHLGRLAARLAAFYATSAPGSSWGSLDVLRANVEENFAQVRPFIGRFVDPQTFEAVSNWQHERLARDANTFEARQEQGRIRDGHGDLRLEHVYFEREQPIVIDGIEFNERFRIGDVAADVSFLAMELDARSRSDLAAGFLAAFAMESDDYDLYGVLDFYLSYRAWVRGKVAGFLAADSSTGPEKAQRKSREAERLFALARAYCERVGAGAVVAVGGLIGAGKSTLAHSLGRALGFPVIESDRTRKALAGVPPTEPAPAKAYTTAFTRRTYDELFRRADVVLRSGRGVILDATFRGRDLRLRARALAHRHGRPFRFVEAICDDDATLRARLRARAAAGGSVSDATEGLLDQIRREFEPVTELAAGEHVPVRTTLPVSAQVQAVRDRLAG